MFSRIRRQATVGNALLMLALVFAMTGGAWAARKYIITSTKQISPKVLRQLRGNEGPAGPQGPAGAPGAKGDIGLEGKQGEKGGNGTNGVNGKSVIATTENTGTANCSGLGGSSFEVESSGLKHFACNGKAGTNGTNGTNGKNVVVGAATSGVGEECPEVGGATVEVEGEASTKKHVCNGSPWTASGTLPEEKTETGAWAYIGNKENGAKWGTALSFTLGLKNSPEAEFLYAGETGAHCTGSAAVPTAPKGYLCVYDEVPKEPGGKPGTAKFTGFSNLAGGSPSGVSKYGAVLGFETQEIGTGFFPIAEALGTWAVTGD